MENFDKFTPQLLSCKRYDRGRLFLMGIKGDINEYYPNSSSYRRKHIIFEKDSDRKLESDKIVKGEALIYDKTSDYIGWKTVYKNTKGSYFKKHGTRYYLN